VTLKLMDREPPKGGSLKTLASGSENLLGAIHRTKDPCQDWVYLLRFLSALTVPSPPLIKVT